MEYVQARRLAGELHKITISPETHDQSVWAHAQLDPTKTPVTACGTTGCLAGNAVLNAGYPLAWFKSDKYDENVGRFVPVWKADDCILPNGEHRTISTAARDLFGLTSGQASRLFEPDNSVADLWDLAIDYSGGHISVHDVIEAFQARAERVKKDQREIFLAAIEKF